MLSIFDPADTFFKFSAFYTSSLLIFFLINIFFSAELTFSFLAPTRPSNVNAVSLLVELVSVTKPIPNFKLGCSYLD